jgi:mannose-6-phosphate isomerase
MTPVSLVPNTTLCSDPYVFSYHEITDDTLRVDAGGVWSLYCHEGGIAIFDQSITGYRSMEAGDIAHGSGTPKVIGSAKLFMVRDPGGEQAVEWLDIQKGRDAYTVTKPWGKEIWLTGPKRGDYCMKCIHITAGHQTSLQYHREKFETNVLVEGCIELVGESPYCEFVKAPAYVNVAPPTVHRVRAITDIILVEASTAHLDDVVRLQDDANRPSGRIEDEHQR